MTLSFSEKKISSLFKNRPRAITNLIDVICTDNGAKSPVQLSLSPLFEGHYSNITKAVHNLSINWRKYRKLLGETVTKIPKKSFYLLAVDVTPCERKYSKKLEDKTFIHKPNTIKGKPITIGHDYSQVVCIPEFSAEDAPWVIPLDMQRVKSFEIGYLKG